VAGQTAHADKEWIHAAIGQGCHVCIIKDIFIRYPMIGQSLDGAVAAVINNESAGIDLGLYGSPQIICVEIVV
jgi:hypothetical protein